MGPYIFVGVEGLEPPCHQLRFLLCIRQSRYTPVLFKFHIANIQTIFELSKYLHGKKLRDYKIMLII